MPNVRQPRVVILNIGSELLHGSTLNTNAFFLAELLDLHCFSVVKQVTVHDERNAILEALSQSCRDADIVVITGGIGPTFDDITVEVVAEFLRAPLLPSAFLLRKLSRFYTHPTPKQRVFMKRQALSPKGARFLSNRVGVATGFLLDHGPCRIAILPGVPREMEEMAVTELLPRLNRLFSARIRYEHLTLKFKRIGETGVVARLKENVFKHPKLRWGIYPRVGEVHLRVYFERKDRPLALKAIRYCAGKLNRFVYTQDERTLAEAVGDLLLRRHKTIAVAESLTGGLLGSRFTEISGSSNYFFGGVIAYSNELKTSLLDVPASLLKKHGAVSRPVALAMARGIRLRSASDIGVSMTGIAGPLGATPTKPVGLVYIAVSSRQKSICRALRFRGTRARIRELTVNTALGLLHDMLRK